MRDKIKVLIITSIICLFYCGVAFGYTGGGTKGNPYIVSNVDELTTILDEKGSNDWVYISLKSNIKIKKTITVRTGYFVINATNGDKTIKRSTSLKDSINDQSNPGYCFRILNTSYVIFGLGGNMLTLDGSWKDLGNANMSGWINVEPGGRLYIERFARLINTFNNEKKSGAPIMTYGDTQINCEIGRCKGYNGGAIKNIKGTLKVYGDTKIHDCVSVTEGGAIHNSQKGTLSIEDSEIWNCEALEEGGAIFSKDADSSCVIYSGKIHNNKSGESAGAVFSGYGATLVIGRSTSGPEIFENTSGGSGGGVRCNGGTGSDAGGITTFIRGTITNNTSGKHGGGIACGEAGENGQSKLYMSYMTISNNTCTESGGGIWTPNNIQGTGTEYAIIQNSRITSNTCHKYGGGISVHGKVYVSNCSIEHNFTGDRGAGIHITEGGTLKYDMGTISDNKTLDSITGTGIYVNGQLKINESARIAENNVVYLPKGKYIEVTGELYKNYSSIAKIESEDKSNGTKLVYINYENGTGEKELYYKGTSSDEYEGKEVQKKYSCVGISSQQLLRTGENVSGIGKNWIIISEKYLIKYDSNTTDEVKNMPSDQVKFWNENIKLSSEGPKREKYIIDTKKHWNYSKDGRGTRISAGAYFYANESRVLYAQWKKRSPKEIYINAKDRYYFKGQGIVINREELLKKVTVTDDVDNGNEYYVRIIEITRTSDNLVNNDSSDDKNDSNSNKNDSTNDKNDSSSDKSDSVSNKSDSSSNKSDSTDNKSDSKNNNSSNKSDSGSKGDYKDNNLLATGSNLVPEKYINTSKVSVYKIKIYTETETASVNATATFKIYVLDNETAIGSVRFISSKYIYTLSDTSKWNKKRNETLNTRLTNALKDSNPMLKVAYTSDEIEQIRKTVKGKGYRITNSLNKNITKEW